MIRSALCWASFDVLEALGSSVLARGLHEGVKSSWNDGSMPMIFVDTLKGGLSLDSDSDNRGTWHCGYIQEGVGDKKNQTKNLNKVELTIAQS